MNIICLADNYVKRTGLVAEHGFSVLLDSGEKNILIDSGQSQAFITNAAAMGLDLKEVDCLVITHGHYDHTGGAAAFLELNKKAVVYAKNGLFRKRFHGESKYIGVPEELWRYKNRITFLDSDLRLDSYVHIITTITEVYPDDRHVDGMNIQEGKTMVGDSFDDELFVLIEEEERISVISACSHSGIANIAESAVRKFSKPLHLVLGGFHLRNESEERVSSSVERLLSYHPDLVAASHCTGLNGYMALMDKAPLKTLYFGTGDTLSW